MSVRFFLRGDWYVIDDEASDWFMFSDQAEADRVADELQSDDYRAEVVPVTALGRRLGYIINVNGNQGEWLGCLTGY